MARIIMDSYMVRYPLGGNLSWAMQWLVGFQRLGHDIYVVEKAGYPNSCYDPGHGIFSDDCRVGLTAVRRLLQQWGLDNKFCYVDTAGTYHGLPRREIERLFATADLFIDIVTNGDWLAEAAGAGVRVMIDVDPGFRQIEWKIQQDRGGLPPRYDHYYSIGPNIGTPQSTAPDLGLAWRHVYNPVVLDLFAASPAAHGAPFTTVMNWRSYESVEYQGRVYGQKDAEFLRFLDLPRRSPLPLEIAVAGGYPEAALTAAGWHLRDARAVTRSYGSYLDYIARSRGEFSVCKHVFRATNSGWFSDRSAAYLASGRPVVLVDTGFSEHLPCGRGLFAVNSVEEAAAALEEIHADEDRHFAGARELAHEYFNSGRVLPRFLLEIGIE